MPQGSKGKELAYPMWLDKKRYLRFKNTFVQGREINRLSKRMGSRLGTRKTGKMGPNDQVIEALPAGHWQLKI